MMEGKETRVMKKVWDQVAESEERITLMKKLIKMGVGVAEVEELGVSIHSKFKSNAFQSRVKNGEIVSKEALKNIMVIKLRDERKHLRELMRKKRVMQSKIEKDLNKNSRPSRRLLKEFREHAAKVRIEYREKYRQKIEHLNKKYRDSKEELARRIPEDMIELGSLRVFDPSRYDDIEKENYDIKIIGDVEIDEKELLVLKLHPKFAILPRLYRGGLDVEEELANAKLRMTISKEIEEQKEKQKQISGTEIIENIEKDEEKHTEEIEMEARTRQVFNPVEKEYDERKRRVTDLKECSRVTLPKPLPAAEEAKIELRRNIHTEIYENFRKENCNKAGEQRSNLTREEQEGLKSLEKKIKDRKIIVIKTDKSSRFAVCSEEAYLRMGRVHTIKDKVINRKELLEAEKILNFHCVAWGKMWGSGDNHDHRSRIVNSKKTASENTADMYILLKDHKEGEKTRPIVTGCTSNTLGMSNNVACVLEAVAASEESPFESISSEDMLAKTKEYNKKVLEERLNMKKRKLRDKIPKNNNDEEDEADKEEIRCGLLRGREPDTSLKSVVLTSQEPTEQGNRSLRGLLESRTQEFLGQSPQEPSVGVLESTPKDHDPSDLGEEEKPGLGNTVLQSMNISEKLGGKTMVRTGAYDETAGELNHHPDGISGKSNAQSNAGLLTSPEEKNLDTGKVSIEAEAVDIDMDMDTEIEKASCLIGCDVVALFPSLSSRKTGEIVRERIMKSKLQFKGFDYKQGTRYIVMNKHLTTNIKELGRTLPWRRKEGGNTPSMQGTMGTKIDDDPEGQWVFPQKELTENEKREIIGRCVEIATRIVFENFCYKFGGDTLKQQEGGPIGARVTMAAARLVMQSWSEGYLDILKRAGVDVGLLTGYVDDVRQVSSCLKKGMRYSKEEKKFLFTELAKEEDEKREQQGESKNGMMARICRDAMNDVNSDLQFTVEVPEDFESERLPTLDFSLWMVDGLLTHTYFQKEMKTPYVLMERSAMSAKQRIEIMSNEATRRLSNIDHENLGAEEQIKVLEQLTQELRNSGYRSEQAREVIISGYRGWSRRLARRRDTGLYRSAKDSLEEREKGKLLERETWYLPKSREDPKQPDQTPRRIAWGGRRLPSSWKRKRQEVDQEDKNQEQKPSRIKAVMFVPCTVGSKLAKELRESENILSKSTGAKLKIVERCGTKIADILTSSDPWKGQDCKREDCLLCMTKSSTGKFLSQDCTRRSVVYETRCMTCEERKKSEIEEKYQTMGEEEMESEVNRKNMQEEISKIRLFKYIGETGKSAHERGKQHLSDALQLKPSSHILKHFLDCHEGESFADLKFGMRIRQGCKSAFERQVTESVLIQQECKEHSLLNSKSEYNRCALPRLTTKLGEKEFEEWKTETQEEKRKEEELEKKIRILRKDRNKDRKLELRLHEPPAEKKRKIEKDMYKTVKQLPQDCRPEKRKDLQASSEEKEEAELLVKDKKMKMEEGEEKEDLKEVPKTIKDKPEDEIDLGIKINWDKEIMEHKKRIEKEIVEDEMKESEKKMINDFNQTWELLKVCVDYIEEGDEEVNVNKKNERIKNREKKERLQEASRLSKESKKLHVQKKITEHFEKLPRKHREKIEMEEIVERRMELQRIKKELWKHRGNGIKHEKFVKKGENAKLREKLERIMEAKEIIRKEEEVEREKKQKAAERIALARQNRRLEELKRLEENEVKRKKMELKRKKESRWEMSKWCHKFLEENIQHWEKEQIRRAEERSKKIAEWEKKSRFDKIRTLKERLKNNQDATNHPSDTDNETDMLEITEKTEQNWLQWRKAVNCTEIIEDNTENQVDIEPIEEENYVKPVAGWGEASKTHADLDTDDDLELAVIAENIENSVVSIPCMVSVENSECADKEDLAEKRKQFDLQVPHFRNETTFEKSEMNLNSKTFANNDSEDLAEKGEQFDLPVLHFRNEITVEKSEMSLNLKPFSNNDREPVDVDTNELFAVEPEELCLLCVHTPCLCDLSKLELKIKMLQECKEAVKNKTGMNLKNEVGGGGGVTDQTSSLDMSLVLSCNPPPQYNPPLEDEIMPQVRVVDSLVKLKKYRVGGREVASQIPYKMLGLDSHFSHHKHLTGEHENDEIRNDKGMNLENGVGGREVTIQTQPQDLCCDHPPSCSAKYNLMGEEAKDYGARPKTKSLVIMQDEEVRNNIGMNLEKGVGGLGVTTQTQPLVLKCDHPPSSSVKYNLMGEEAKAYGARPKLKPLATMPSKERKLMDNKKTLQPPKPLEPVQVRNQPTILKYVMNASTNPTTPPIPPTNRNLGSQFKNKKSSDINQTELNNQLSVDNIETISNNNPQLSQITTKTKLENKLPKSTLAKFSRMLGNQQPPPNTVKPPPIAKFNRKTTINQNQPLKNHPQLYQGPNQKTVIKPPVSKKIPINILEKFNSMLATKTTNQIEPTTPKTNCSRSTPPTSKSLAKLATKRDTPTNKPVLRKRLKPAKPEKPTPDKRLGDNLKQWLLREEKTFLQVPRPKSDGTVER